MILGIDPSYTCTGVVCLDSQYALISHFKIRLTPGPDRMLRAAKAMHSCILSIETSCGGALKLAVIEDAAYGAPSRITVAKLKELSGVYKAVLEGHHVPWLELSPSSAKRFITGKGTAEKHVVAREVGARWNLVFHDDKGYDLSDAAALAIWGVDHFYGQETGFQKTGK